MTDLLNFVDISENLEFGKIYNHKIVVPVSVSEALFIKLAPQGRGHARCVYCGRPILPELQVLEVRVPQRSGPDRYLDNPV